MAKYLMYEKVFELIESINFNIGGIATGAVLFAAGWLCLVAYVIMYMEKHK